MGDRSGGTIAYLANDNHYSGGRSTYNRCGVSPLGDFIRGIAASLVLGTLLGIKIFIVVYLIDWVS